MVTGRRTTPEEGVQYVSQSWERRVSSCEATVSHVLCPSVLKSRARIKEVLGDVEKTPTGDEVSIARMFCVPVADPVVVFGAPDEMVF